MKNTKLIWIAVPILIIIAGIYFAWSKNLIPGFGKQINEASNETKSANTQNNPSQSDMPGSTQYAPPEGSANLDVSEEIDSPEGKRSEEKPDEALRQQVIAYVNQNLNKLAVPPAKDKWDIPTFYFVGNSNVYVELYGEETDLTGAKILYKAEKSANTIKLTEVARYKEGDEDWILSSGQDNLDNYVMEEYDLNEDNNKWEKTDEFTDEYYLDESADLSEESDSGMILP